METRLVLLYLEPIMISVIAYPTNYFVQSHWMSSRGWGSCLAWMSQRQVQRYGRLLGSCVRVGFVPLIKGEAECSLWVAKLAHSEFCPEGKAYEHWLGI